MRPDIESFPPPQESGQVLGHDGQLTAEEVQHLAHLGYTVAHFKSFSGNKLIQAYYEGLAKGLIELVPSVFKSMEAIRKQIQKMDKDESSLKDARQSAKVDVLELLTKAEDEDTLAPTKRRGRPPGK